MPAAPWQHLVQSPVFLCHKITAACLPPDYRLYKCNHDKHALNKLTWLQQLSSAMRMHSSTPWFKFRFDQGKNVVVLRSKLLGRSLSERCPDLCLACAMPH